MRSHPAALSDFGRLGRPLCVGYEPDVDHDGVELPEPVGYNPRGPLQLRQKVGELGPVQRRRPPATSPIRAVGRAEALDVVVMVVKVKDLASRGACPRQGYRRRAR